jgi:hypothetical protein
MTKRALPLAARKFLLCFCLLVVSAAFPRGAAAEKIIASTPDWEIFTDGRAGGYVSWAYGQGVPPGDWAAGPNGSLVQVDNIQAGTGLNSSHSQGFLVVPGVTLQPGQTYPPDQGTINMMRVRSGFIDNIFGFGVRSMITPTTKVMAYIQLWMFVESDGRVKNRPNPLDARQGYAQLEGPWGSLLIGRTRALFSRGATDIDVLYAHRWGVGWPGSIDSFGPALGQIGFGVLGSGFAPGVIYGTPTVGGLHLNVGAFDPIALPASGAWTRTTYLRPEAELTFEQRFGASGKIVLFGNGAYQKVYKDGLCILTPTNPCEATAAGFGYGGRFELGPFHLGVAGHYGQGLGLNYALEASPAAQDLVGNLRRSDGYYIQTQVVVRRFDLFAGVGITRFFLTDYDRTDLQPDLRDPTMTAQVHAYSVLKDQWGANAGIVFNYNASLHFDLDFFRAQDDWFAVNSFPSAQQVVWVGNSGMIYSW